MAAKKRAPAGTSRSAKPSVGDQFLSFSLLPVQIVRFVYGKQKARKYEPFLSQTTSPLQQPLPCVFFLLQMRLRLVAASPHHVYVPL
jgi:hypothetical protein